MKKIIFICLMFLALHTDAKEWESYWIAAIEDYHHQNYISAEHNFTSAIQLIENNNELKHPSIYVDRARVYLHLNRYEEALSDAEKAIFSNNLHNKERVRAVYARLAAKANLEIIEGYEEDIEFLVKNFDIQVENMENHMMIRNMPKSKKFRKSMTYFLIHAGICDRKEDIKILSSDICIVNKTASKSYCQTANKDINKHVDRDVRLIEDCKRWCDANAVAAISWCSYYPEFCVVNACNQAVFEIQNNCHGCCQRGFTQDLCAEPYANIVGVMQKYLRPSCGIR